jgi:hypothetical protein
MDRAPGAHQATSGMGIRGQRRMIRSGTTARLRSNQILPYIPGRRAVINLGLA